VWLVTNISNEENHMDNYVQQMWQDHNVQRTSSKATRIAAWILGTAVAVALIAMASQAYWYPYVAPYL
jgi:hypothetical protein